MLENIKANRELFPPKDYSPEYRKHDNFRLGVEATLPTLLLVAMYN